MMTEATRKHGDSTEVELFKLELVIRGWTIEEMKCKYSIWNGHSDC